ncbi:Ribonuclease H superfamily [Sesbania bispinosa]|nr:Ribonuclease H superfamily [Sesbania bispinosa]
MSHEDFGHRKHSQMMETPQRGHWFPQHGHQDYFGAPMSHSLYSDSSVDEGTRECRDKLWWIAPPIGFTKLNVDRSFNEYKKVHFETDSLEVIHLLNRDSSSLFGQTKHLMEQLKALLSRSWEISVSHVFREANMIANYLAHFNTRSSGGVADWREMDVFIPEEYVIKRRLEKKVAASAAATSSSSSKSHSSHRSSGGVAD